MTIGKINAAYEIFVNGVKVGGVGQLPPNPVSEYDRYATYVVPSPPQPTLSIALRVWRPPHRDPGDAGATGGPFEIGPRRLLLERARVAEVDRLGLVLVFTPSASTCSACGCSGPPRASTGCSRCWRCARPATA